MALFKTGVRRVAPWPYQAVIAGNGYMMGYSSAEDTQLISENPPAQSNVSPPNFQESSVNPVFGVPIGFADLSGGYGLQSQRDGVTNRYWYGIAFDGSQGIMQKGPHIPRVTPAAGTNVTRFFEADGILFAISGRYCIYMASDTVWSTAKDLNAGKLSTDAVTFTSSGSGITISFVAMGDSEYFWYRTAGGVATAGWTQHTSLCARNFERVGREFWRASATNNMAKVDVDADPLTAANWTAINAYSVGTKDAGIVRIGGVNDGTMFIFKEDGIYSFDGAGEDYELFPQLRMATASTNASAYTTWKNDRYVAYGTALYRLTSDGVLTQVGPELMTDNASPIKGRITALCGTPFALYAGIWNPDTSAAYLIKYQGEVAKDSNGREYHVWHGSLSKAWTAQISAMHESSIGADSGHTRLYMGFSDGKVAYFNLPCTPNPTGCSSYRWAYQDAEDSNAAINGLLYLPTLDMGFPSDSKSLLAANATSLNFDSSNYCKFDYRTLRTGSYDSIGTDFDTNPRKRVAFPIGGSTGESCVLLDSLITLVNAATTATPQLIRFSVEYQLRPALKKVFTFNILAEDGLFLSDNTPMRIGAHQIRSRIEAARNTAGTVTAQFIDETSRNISVIDTSETIAWYAPRGKWSAAIKVVATEHSQLYGQYGNLEPFTYAQLEAFTYGQLETL